MKKLIPNSILDCLSHDPSLGTPADSAKASEIAQLPSYYHVLNCLTSNFLYKSELERNHLGKLFEQ